MSDQEIKPCPNCGGEDIRPDNHQCNVEIAWWLYCGTCELCGPEAPSTPEAAIETWNALPRREEFYAELVEIMESSDDGDYTATRFKLKKLLEKYAPDEPSPESYERDYKYERG